MRLATMAAAFVLFSAPLAVEAQQQGKVYRFGILANKLCGVGPLVEDPGLCGLGAAGV